MGNKKGYKEENTEFLKKISKDADVYRLPGGILYKVLNKGAGLKSPETGSVVVVHYNGRLISGEVFDNTFGRESPEAFRVREVIEGWQIALQHMHEGDRWIIYIPYNLGYGCRAVDGIPGFSTLIFDVELISIA